MGSLRTLGMAAVAAVLVFAAEERSFITWEDDDVSGEAATNGVE
jgi:hypothetical protein